MNWSEFAVLLPLALASGVVAVTITKTHIFLPIRVWLHDRNNWLYTLVTCFYCLGHWISAAAVVAFQPRILEGVALIPNLLVSWLVLTALTAFVSGLILRTEP